MGQLRVTMVTPEIQDHIGSTIPMGESLDDGVYATNIQVADLNALNAILAVVRWKKHCQFYLDLEGEHSSFYTLDGNEMVNEVKDGSLRNA